MTIMVAVGSSPARLVDGSAFCRLSTACSTCHDGGCESKPGSADSGFSQTTATQIVERGSPFRSPDAGGGLVNEGRRFVPGQAGRFVWRPGPRNGVGGPPRQAGGPVATLEGEATPARSARNLTAVGKSHLLTFLTSSAASPPSAQTQQRRVFRFQSTWKLGSWSSWNGQGQSRRGP